MTMRKYEIVRRVDGRELATNRASFASNLMMTLRFRTCRLVDLFASTQRLNQVRETIRAWKSMHPLLRAQVIRTCDSRSHYFAIDESSNQNLEKNVKFLRLKHSRNKPTFSRPVNENLVYELLFERLISDRIDLSDSTLLWRLALVELKQDGDELVYELFWSVHHAIADEPSMRENLRFLLELIETSVRGGQIELREFDVYPGDMSGYEEESEPVASIQPEFVRPSQAIAHASQSLDRFFTSVVDEIDEFEMIDLNANNPVVYASFAQLVEFASKSSVQKPKRFVVYESEYLKLQQKCQEEEVKSTSLFNTLVWVSLVRLYKRHNAHLDEIRFRTALDTRRLAEPHTLGYCVRSRVDSVRNEFANVLDDREVLGNFWRIAHENSEKTEKLWDVEEAAAVHTGLSNVGSLDTSRLEWLRVENAYVFGHVSVQHTTQLLFYNHVITVGERLFWSVTSNSHFFDHQLVDEFIDLVNELIIKLTDF